MRAVAKNKESAKDIVNKTMERCKKQYWEFTEAIALLEPEPFPQMCLMPFSTDGEKLFFSEERVIREYDKDRFETLSHELMHAVLHLIFDDPEEYRNTKTKKLYSAYADLRLDILQFYLEVPKDQQERDFFFCDKPAVRKYCEFHRFMDGAEKIPDSFFELKNDKSLAGKILRQYKPEDDHDLWVKPVKKVVVAKWDEVRSQIASSGGLPENVLKGMAPVSLKLEDIGKIMSERDAILMPEGDKSETWGSEEGNTCEKYKAAKDNEKTYIDIIKDFFKEKESSREDPETIDRMMYSYGFDLYENVALIEPSEETDKKALGTIALAIDTSGSCSGDVAQRFLREISNLFRDISDVGTFDEILLYQCDCLVQDRRIITDPDDIPADMDDYSLMGFGGTSFVPVFEDIEEYSNRTDAKVDALFYLTDGWGDYPKKEPPYKTFFIFPEELGTMLESFGHVPEWITKLVMGENHDQS